MTLCPLLSKAKAGPATPAVARVARRDDEGRGQSRGAHARRKSYSIHPTRRTGSAAPEGPATQR